MPMTIKHNDNDKLVVVAKLLTGFILINEKVCSPDDFIRKNSTFNADFVAHMCSWQSKHNLTADGIIDENCWAVIAKNAPMCSTAKNRISSATLALQILLDSKITCDGIYGNRTKSAVAVFQDAKKLKADGVCGPKTWAALLGEVKTQTTATISSTTTSEPVKYKSTVNYKQHDSCWGKKNYTSCGNKNQTMSNSGCGPTAMANIIATLVDSNVTPWDLAQLAMKWGDRTKSSGTSVSFFKHIQEHYRFKKMIGTGSLDTVKACLDAGGYVVCRMGPGYWTNGGHYITAWMYDKNYIYCNDPSSPTSKRAERKKQKLSEFLKERKDFWCFYPEREGRETAAPFEQAAKAEDIKDFILDAPDDLGSLNTVKSQVDEKQKPVFTADPNKAIIDISKHDGKIDFEALKPYVSLVIARASLGSDPDERFAEYAKEMNRLGIPFGVYCYSYARDSAKGVDEAAKLRGYTKAFDPLFYVMDIEEECVTQLGIKAFAGTIRALGGKPVGAYVAHHRYKEYGFDDLRHLFDFVWIPRYPGNDIGEPTGKKPDYACDLWQYTENGRIPGINGTVDKNLITGTGKDLSWFLGGDA